MSGSRTPLFAVIKLVSRYLYRISALASYKSFSTPQIDLAHPRQHLVAANPGTCNGTIVAFLVAGPVDVTSVTTVDAMVELETTTTYVEPELVNVLAPVARDAELTRTVAVCTIVVACIGERSVGAGAGAATLEPGFASLWGFAGDSPSAGRPLFRNVAGLRARCRTLSPFCRLSL